MDINKWLETAALPAEHSMEKSLQTEISPLERPQIDLVPWDVTELAKKFSQPSYELAKKFCFPSSESAGKFSLPPSEPAGKFSQTLEKEWSALKTSGVLISPVVSEESVFLKIEKAREEKEARRHKEMLEALKEAAKSGATIQIGDNAHDIQIQQGTVSSSQTISKIEQEFDYEKAEKIIRDIASYTQYPQFVETFGENSETAKATIENMLVAVEKKEDKRIIKSLAMELKNLAIGVVGSLIASGIIAQLGNLGI